MLLITGANGQLGRLIVESVLRRAPDAPLAVSVRDAAKAADLADRGVDVRQAGYHDPEPLAAAFAGVQKLLLMPTATADPAARANEMAPVAKAGVKHVVYPGTAQVEGLDFRLLKAHAEVFELAPPGRRRHVAPVLRTDLAAAIATVLLEDGHAGKTYDLAGPDAIGWNDLAQLASERAGWSGPSEDRARLAGRPVTPSLQAVAAVLDGTAK